MTSRASWLSICTSVALSACIASDDITQTATSEAALAVENGEWGSGLAERLDRVERILGQADDGSFADVATRLDTLEQQRLDSRLSDVEDRLGALELRVGDQGENEAVYTELASLRGDVLSLRTDVGDVEDDEEPLVSQARSLDARVFDMESTYASVAYVEGEIAATELYCDSAVDDLDAAIPDVVSADETWTVDGSGATSTTFATPAAAVAAAQAVRIAPNAVLTIEIDDGTYTMTTPLAVRHPDGARLEIVGNTSDPSRVVLSFEGSDGLVVDDGYVLGLLDGVTVQGDGAGTQKAAVRVNAAMARLGPATRLTGFSGFGVWASTGAIVIAGDVQSTSQGVDGFFVDHGSVLEAPGATASSNRHGVAASGGSYVDFAGGTTTSNSQIGLYALNGSAVNAVGASSTSNGSDGFRAYAGTSFYAPGASGSGNATGRTFNPSPNVVDNANSIIVQ